MSEEDKHHYNLSKLQAILEEETPLDIFNLGDGLIIEYGNSNPGGEKKSKKRIVRAKKRKIE